MPQRRRDSARQSTARSANPNLIFSGQQIFALVKAGAPELQRETAVLGGILCGKKSKSSPSLILAFAFQRSPFYP